MDLGKQHGEKEDHNTYCDGADKGGVEHTGEHLLTDGLFLFKVVNDFSEDGDKVASGLAGFDNIGAGAVKVVGLTGEGTGKGAAFAEVTPQGLGKGFKLRLAESLAEDFNGVSSGQARAVEFE